MQTAKQRAASRTAREAHNDAMAAAYKVWAALTAPHEAAIRAATAAWKATSEADYAVLTAALIAARDEARDEL